MRRPACFVIVVLSAVSATADDLPNHDAVDIKLGETSVMFRRISPRVEQIGYPDFYLLETEVTNRQYREYLRATGRTKDDVDVLAELQKREPTTTELLGGGVRVTMMSSTGDIPYSVEDATTVWREGDYPPGLDEHPVALITLPEAEAFCDWLTASQPERGRFRLPTWNEWMIAAYGRSRRYPWGNDWNAEKVCTSHGRSFDDSRKQTEPVRARPAGRTPDGLFGMLGNVSELLAVDDSRNAGYFNLGARWLGGGFDDGRPVFRETADRPLPRKDYWGYSHHAALRTDDIGFRVLLDATNDPTLVDRPRIFPQRDKSWQVERK
jgi:formylglycine-generating enzyme required for sulfatase activity